MTDPSDTIAATHRRRAILSCIFGNAFELYDFTIYGLLAAAIGKTFFPSVDPLVSLLAAFASFGAGFIMRPLGGLVIGAYADRHGRRGALVISLLLMGVSTGLIGLVPSHAQIGLAAPAILLLLRLVQGFSAGGEWGGAAAFLVEHAPPGRRGFFGSWHQVGVGVGTLVGSSVIYAVYAWLPADAADAWGWRLPFLIGGLLAPLGYYLRRHVRDTPAFEHSSEAAEAAAPAIPKLDIKPIAQAAGSTIVWTVSGYVYFTFITAFAIQTLKLPIAGVLASNSIATFVRMVLTPVMGHLSDRFGRKPLMIGVAVSMLALSAPAFILLTQTPTWTNLLIVQLFAAVALAAFSGPAPAFLCELFPIRARSTSLSLAYNLVAAIFGGFAPFICTLLVRVTGQAFAPAYYVATAALISIATLWFVKDRYRAIEA